MGMINHDMIRYGAGILAGLGFLTCAGMTIYSGSGYGPKNDFITQTKSNKDRGLFIEDKTGSDEMVDIEQAKEAEKEMTTLYDNMENLKQNSNPKTISIQGHKYYIFNHDILMPLNEYWTEYVIPASDEGNYDSISEFYLKEESPGNWTQKFTIHKVKHDFNEDSQKFMERLITGVLVTISDRMALEGNELSKDDISFNYIKKEDNDCILYWGMKGLEEVQFVRIFRSEKSNDLYVLTASYKIDISAIDTDFVVNKRAELESVQQLKKKG